MPDLPTPTSAPGESHHRAAGLDHNERLLDGMQLEVHSCAGNKSHGTSVIHHPGSTIGGEKVEVLERLIEDKSILHWVEIHHPGEGIRLN